MLGDLSHQLEIHMFSRKIFLTLNILLVLDFAPALAAPAKKPAGKPKSTITNKQSGTRQSTFTDGELKAYASLTEAQRKEFVDALAGACDDNAAGRFDAAEKGFEKAISINPGGYKAHLYRAVVLRDLRRFDEAVLEGTTAMQLEPNKSECLGALADIRLAEGNLEEALKLNELYLLKFPKDPQAQTARALVSRFKAALEAKNAPSLSDDYFNEVTEEMTTKWRTNRFPLKVFIAPDSQFSKEVESAFDDWQTKSNDLVSFTMVSDSKQSDIECTFSSNRSRFPYGEKGGATPTLSPDTGIEHARIEILATKETTPGELKLLALHEVGHSLGLLGHSPAADDAMYFLGTSQLTDRDIKTLRHLYQPDIKIALGTKKVVRPDEVETLLMEANKLMMSSDFKSAQTKLEAALKIDPKNRSLRFNLAQCLNQISMATAQQGNLAGAEAGFKRAIQFADEKTFRAQLLHNLAVVYQAQNKSALAQEAGAASNKLDPDAGPK
jgi:tetratricopeptide (TPR) repeat protein